MFNYDYVLQYQSLEVCGLTGTTDCVIHKITGLKIH